MKIIHSTEADQFKSPCVHGGLTVLNTHTHTKDKQRECSNEKSKTKMLTALLFVVVLTPF